ncbi:MAG: CDP-diacylglycerol--glycerol-3-phosphate 3-phosphatidyltransferase [Pseudomonadota bacterium]
MAWTLPNILTFFRVLAAPCVALAFVLLERPLADWVALTLFVAAAVTDFFDGWLARKLGQMSELGKMLDPIADKAMVIVALVVLAWTHRAVDAWIVAAALIATREVVVSGVREYLGDVKLPVTRLAKWKTTVQMVAIGVLLAVHPVFAWEAARMPDEHWIGLNDFLGLAGVILIWLAAAMTVLSGVDYLRKAAAILRKREESR